MNERVLLKGEWKWGNLIQSYVGATNVGNIEIKFDKTVQQKKQEGPTMSSQIVGEDLTAGEEVGRFLMGSSVVSIVEVPKDFVWDVKQGDTVKYGQRIGH